MLHVSHFRPALVWALIALGAVAFTGCASSGSRGKILVPKQNTAGMQYFYAERMRKQADLPLLFPKKKEYREAREMVYQCWTEVVKNFPADREMTPIAKLNLIEMDAGLDDQHAPKSPAAYKRAIKAYQAVIQEYPENAFVQAKARYDQALCHKARGEFDDATEIFRYLRDTYGKDTNPQIKAIAEKSAAYYQQTYTVEK